MPERPRGTRYGFLAQDGGELSRSSGGRNSRATASTESSNPLDGSSLRLARERTQRIERQGGSRRFAASQRAMSKQKPWDWPPEMLPT